MIGYIKRLSLLLFAFLQVGCLPAIEEFPYEPEFVELEGTLMKKIVFGPPNYGESPETDIRLRIHVLNLKQPIVAGTSDTLSDLNDSVVANVKEVQVVFVDRALLSKIRVGENVVLKGQLYKGIRGPEYYQVVLRVGLRE